MDTTDWIAAAAVLVAAGGLYFTWLSGRAAVVAARAAESQVQLQVELNKAASQPYVWADVRVSDYQGHFLVLVLGNNGPTVATDVKVTFDPPLPSAGKAAPLLESALTRLGKGMQSLAPGKELIWPLGASEKIVGEDRSQPHAVTVEARGPHGPTEKLTYVIDLADFRESADHPGGSLHLVTRAIRELTDATTKAHR